MEERSRGATPPNLSMRDALSFIENQFYSFEVQKDAWNLERSALQMKVDSLTVENEHQAVIIAHQNRRIDMLEQVLRTERRLRNSPDSVGSSSTPETSETNATETFPALHSQQSQSIQSLASDLQRLSEELTTLMEKSSPRKSIPLLTVSSGHSGSRSFSENVNTRLSVSAAGRKKSDPVASGKQLRDSSELDRPLFQKGASKAADRTSVPTILDSLGDPLDDDDEWADEEAAVPLASSRARSKESVVLNTARRSTSDTSVKLRAPEASEPPRSSNPMLQSLGTALENSESIVEEPFGTVKEFHTWKQLATTRAHFDCIRCVQFHPTDPVFLSASDDSTLKLWRVDNLHSKKMQADSIQTYYGHKAAVLKCAINAEGTEFFSAGLDHQIMKWKLPDDPMSTDPFESHGTAISRRLRVLEGHKDAVWDVAVHPQKDSLLFSSSADGTVKIWNHKRMSSPCLHTLSPSSGTATPTSLAILHSDPNHLLVGYNNSTLDVVDIETATVLHTLQAPSSSQQPDLSTQINQVISHQTRPLVFTAHEDHSIQYFDVRQKECVHSMVGHLDGVSSLAIEPTGEYLFSGGHDSSLRVWHIGSRTCVQELMANRKKFDESIQSVACHPRINLIASSGADANIKLLKQNLPLSTVP